MRFNLKAMFVLVGLVAVAAWVLRLIHYSESRTMARFRNVGGFVDRLDDSTMYGNVPPWPTDRKAMLADLTELREFESLVFECRPSEPSLIGLPEFEEHTRADDVRFIPTARLRGLGFYGHGIHDNDTLKLGYAPHLVRVSFIYVPITGSCLSRFANDRLLTLSFIGCPLAPESARYISCCSRLEELSIDAGDYSPPKTINFGDAELAHVLPLRHLRELSLRGTVITDNGVQLIAQHWPNLELLDLENSPITDESVVHLAKLKSLKHLALGAKKPERCLMSKAAAIWLVKNLPECWISYRCGNDWIHSSDDPLLETQGSEEPED